MLASSQNCIQESTNCIEYKFQVLPIPAICLENFKGLVL